MRIWSLHPTLLDRQALVACWRETLLADEADHRGYRFDRSRITAQRSTHPTQLTVTDGQLRYEKTTSSPNSPNAARTHWNTSLPCTQHSRRNSSPHPHIGYSPWLRAPLKSGKRSSQPMR